MGFIHGEGRGYRRRKDSPSCAFVDLTVLDDDEQLPAKDRGIHTIENAKVLVRKWMLLKSIETPTSCDNVEFQDENSLFFLPPHCQLVSLSKSSSSSVSV